MLETKTSISVERTKTESMKPPVHKSNNMPPLFDEPVTIKNWTKFVNWPSTFVICVPNIITLYGVFTTKLQMKTLIWSGIYYFFSALGITAGYHRLWSHRAYRATNILQWSLVLCGSAAIQGSVYEWSEDHRVHHRWTDTNKDPYNAQRGLFFSHFGRMLIKRPKSRTASADITDLKANYILALQDRFYIAFVLVMGFIVPTLVAGLGWGDFRGGFFYACALCITSIQHATFCSSRFFVHIVTLGEGYHNFHHQFPLDYRNAIRYYQFDPTKWMIIMFSWLGLAYDLKQFPENEISKGAIYMEEKRLSAQKSKLSYGTPLKNLSVYTWEEFQSCVLKDNKKWILIEGVLYDVERFIKEHPGGKGYILHGVGKDMTAAFNGGVYDHSNGFRNLLTSFRVGVLLNGMQVITEADALT